MPSEIIHLEGHVIDSLTLSKVLDILSSYEGVRYEIRHAKIGHTREETSHFEILVQADTETQLEEVLTEVQQHGANFSHEDAHLEPAPKDGVFPEDFYPPPIWRPSCACIIAGFLWRISRWIAAFGYGKRIIIGVLPRCRWRG